MILILAPSSHPGQNEFGAGSYAPKWMVYGNFLGVVAEKTRSFQKSRLVSFRKTIATHLEVS